MPTVKVNDINIYYEIHGDGFPLVMIRGLSSDVHRWPLNFIDMISKNFKTILFDNRGAGRTDKPDIEYSVKIMVDDTIGLMDALNVDQAHALGISGGGYIAQQMGLSYPQRIKKLVLCSTSAGGTKNVFPTGEALEFLMGDWRKLTPEEVIRKSIPFIFTEEFIRNKKEHVENYIQRALMTPASPTGASRQKEAMVSYRGGRELKKLTIPTLILHGKEDILIPTKNGEILAGLIPGAKLVLFDKIAHGLFSHEIELVAKTIIGFLG